MTIKHESLLHCLCWCAKSARDQPIEESVFGKDSVLVALSLLVCEVCTQSTNRRERVWERLISLVGQVYN